MDKIILVRYGEIVLKGLNRHVFEERLVANIKRSLHMMPRYSISISQARIYITPLEDDFDIDEAIEKLQKVFGIVSVSIVHRTECEFEHMAQEALTLVDELLLENNYKTFKVETRRANKKFFMKSPEVSAEIGGRILAANSCLSVDVNNPDFIIYVEIRDQAYLYSKKIMCTGGLPVGSNGKAALLLSGGIDSPVAGWMMGKRGLALEAVHFYSFPYTGERAKEKVLTLAKKLSEYTYYLKVHIVPFTDIQLAIRDNCPEDELTIIMRRIMMQITEKIASQNDCNALITGESLGQVASQTIMSLGVTNAAVDMPVFRPLIGMDKEEVISIARKIGTFETSILPYEDCCTVFVAKHPKTKPRLDAILKSEEKLDIVEMIEKSINEREIIMYRNGEELKQKDE